MVIHRYPSRFVSADAAGAAALEHEIRKIEVATLEFGAARTGVTPAPVIEHVS